MIRAAPPTRTIIASRMIYVTQPHRSFFGTNEPIEYKTKQVIPYKQEHFYKVAIDVNNYRNFVPYMTSSRILEETHK